MLTDRLPGMLNTKPPLSTDPSLYDMDIVFDPPGSGMFSEVYLYEEQMEADLHAIVGLAIFLPVLLCRALEY